MVILEDLDYVRRYTVDRFIEVTKYQRDAWSANTS